MDNLANGRKIRLLNILEVFSKESLAMHVDTSINGTRVSQVLDQLSWTRGITEVITVDNAFIESFNRIAKERNA